MKKYILVFLVLFPVCAGVLNAVTNYSADMIDLSTGRITGRVFASGPNIRVEQFNSTGNMAAVFIIRMNEMRMFFFDPASRIYIELPIVETQASAFENLIMVTLGLAQPDSEPFIVRERQGLEVINGHLSEIYHISIVAITHEMTQIVDLYTWLVPDMSWPIRTLSPFGEWVELRNILPGVQPLWLFDILPGYTFYDIFNIYND